MSGQHVGGVNDLPPLPEEPGGARAALARVMKPAGREYRGGGTTGDGDPCPLVPSHGRMLVIPQTWHQVCPNQEHDGIWKPGDHQPPTPSRWPVERSALRAAVQAYEEGRNA